MRVIEILLPRQIRDKDISNVKAEIDMLRSEIIRDADALKKPGISPAGKDFLMQKIKNNYEKIRSLGPKVDLVAESFEVINTKTNKVVGKPHKTKMSATAAKNKLDDKHGSKTHSVRKIKTNKPVLEAVNKVPLTDKDFDEIKEIMEKPIPAILAPMYISEIIDDDDLNSQLMLIAEDNPNKDIRFMIANWIDRVMPDQKYRFTGEPKTFGVQAGVMSPIHGYDTGSFKSDPGILNGNAFGRF